MKLKQRTRSDPASRGRRPLALIVLLTALWTLLSAIELVPGAAASGLDLGGAASTATSAVSNVASTATSAVPAAPTPAPAPSPPQAPAPAPTRSPAPTSPPASPTPPVSTPAPVGAATKAVAPVVHSVAQVQSEASGPEPPAPTPAPSNPAPEPKLPAAVGDVTSAAAGTINSVGSDLTSATGGGAGLPELPAVGSLPNVDEATNLVGSVVPTVGSVVAPVASTLPAISGLTETALAVPGSLLKTLPPVAATLPTILDPVVKSVDPVIGSIVPQALAPIRSALPALSGLGKLVPPLAAVTAPITRVPGVHLPTPTTNSPGPPPPGGGIPGGGGSGTAPAPTTPLSPRYDVWLQANPGGGQSSDLPGFGRGGLGHPAGLLVTSSNPLGAAGSNLPATRLSPPIEPGNGPQNSPSAPLPTPPGTSSSGGGIGGSFFIPLAALMALVALSAPATKRRLREAAALPAPTPFVCALERPG